MSDEAINMSEAGDVNPFDQLAINHERSRALMARLLVALDEVRDRQAAELDRNLAEVLSKLQQDGHSDEEVLRQKTTDMVGWLLEERPRMQMFVGELESRMTAETSEAFAKLRLDARSDSLSAGEVQAAAQRARPDELTEQIASRDTEMQELQTDGQSQALDKCQAELLMIKRFVMPQCPSDEWHDILARFDWNSAPVTIHAEQLGDSAIMVPQRHAGNPSQDRESEVSDATGRCYGRVGVAG
ncbi:hypothetical protein ACHAPJ_010085 [Fusarium lateritium]